MLPPSTRTLQLAKYAAREGVSTAFYLGFVASWAALRQLYCPLAVCRSTLLEAWSLVRRYGPSTRHVAIWAGFNALVLVLQARCAVWGAVCACVAECVLTRGVVNGSVHVCGGCQVLHTYWFIFLLQKIKGAWHTACTCTRDSGMHGCSGQACIRF
jgi:hypothetical protein